MDLNYLKKLIKMLDTSNLAEIEIEEEGTKLRLSKPRPKVVAGSSPNMLQTELLPAPQVMPAAKEEKVPEKTVTPPSENYYEVRSPMVGTFYKAPSPDADSYVKVNDRVSPGTVLCIIEAMKLMNEIESEVSGRIVKVLVENAQAVEYDQPLFLIEKE